MHWLLFTLIGWRNKMNKDYSIVKNYREDNNLRNSFNKLAENTYGITFEPWYQNGYWTEKYIPYSIVNKEEVVANISVNPMKFIEKGSVKHYIQLGTVMTDKAYRNQGLSRNLMEIILNDYKDKVDGFYLFANDSVLEFYPKFGFNKSNEYQYVKTVDNKGKMKATKILMENKRDWDVLESAIKKSIIHSEFEMVHNPELILFHITNFMKDCVYYIESLDAYVIVEIEGEELFIHNVFGENETDIDSIVNSFGNSIKKVTLGFTPIHANGFEVMEHREEDTTLFVMGKNFDLFTDKQIMFPTLSHA